MEKDGCWLGGSGYGHGYPLDGFGFGHHYPIGGYPTVTAGGYGHARPGYDVRILLVAANILARQGQQQPCEDVLSTTRDIYKLYMADMQSGGRPMADIAGWRQREIAAALPVANDTSFRSDQLLGTDVRSPHNEALGSVDDLVMSPQTGKIAYLVIARGGIFGIGQKYVPVPWEDFKVTPNGSLLVLNTTKGAMDAAPQVDKDQFATVGQQNEKVDAYWKSSFLNKGN
jgi:sporulation protein YlmC with PRC-barrel domain